MCKIKKFLMNKFIKVIKLYQVLFKFYINKILLFYLIHSYFNFKLINYLPEVELV